MLDALEVNLGCVDKTSVRVRIRMLPTLLE
jgi:hypothetical protein